MKGVVDRVLLESTYSVKCGIPPQCQAGVEPSRMQSCEFPATCQVRTVCACLDTCSSPYSSDTCGPMAASCKPSSPASLCRDSFSPSSESLGLSFSWQILVSASSGCSSPTQLELTSSLLSDKKKKKKKSHLAPVKKHFSFSELVMPPVFMRHAWVRVKSLQTRLTLCDPMDHQAPLSMGFSRHEYWSSLPCPPLGDLPSPGIEPMSFMSITLAGFFFTTSTTWKAPLMRQTHSIDLL